MRFRRTLAMTAIAALLAVLTACGKQVSIDPGGCSATPPTAGVPNCDSTDDRNDDK